MADATHIYSITRDPKNPKEAIACVDLCESFDDDGWYAHEYDFTREDNKTRVSANNYRTEAELVAALKSGQHAWTEWS